MFQMKEQDRTSEKDFNDSEVCKSTDKEFKIMANIKMIAGLKGKMDKCSENFSRERENIRKDQTEVTDLKRKVSEMCYRGATAGKVTH